MNFFAPMMGAGGVLAGWASTPRLGAFQTRRCCALFHAPHPRAPKTSVIQGRLADDAPVFANPSAGVVDGLGSGLGVDAGGSGVGVGAGGSGVTLGVGTGVLGSGLGAGVLGSGVGAGGSGVTLGVGTGVLGSGLGAGVLGSGVGAGGSGLGVGTEGSGVGVGAGGTLGLGSGAGVLGSGVGAGGTLGLGSGVGAGAGVGVGTGGGGSGHSCVELSHSTQPFPLHSPAKGAAWDLPPNRRIVPRRPTRVASRAILSGVRLLGLVVMIFPFVGGALM